MEDFIGVIPIVKADPAKNGKMVIHGVACDPSLDLQGEITDPAGIACSIPYLKKWGKLNADHSKKLVGDVLDAEVVTKGELSRRGILKGIPSNERNEQVLYVKGSLYQFVPEAVHFYDVLRSGGKLGFSIQGKVLEREEVTAKSVGARPVTINRKCFINQIAVTGQPVNPGVWASISKSFGGGHSGHSYMLRELQKGLECVITTGNNPVVAGDSGASVLREQSLEGDSKKRRRRRKMEGHLEDYMDLETPKQLVKAWRDELPGLVKSLGVESADDIAAEFVEAVKANGLAASTKRDRGGVTTLTKGLGEDDLSILDMLDKADASELAEIMKGGMPDEDDEEEDETEEPENEEGNEDDSKEHEEDETEEEEEQEHKPARKSLEDEMLDDPDTAAALEVAPFLQGMTKHISKALEAMPDVVIEGLADVIAEGIAVGIVKAIKPVSDRLELIEKSIGSGSGKTDEEIADIRKSLEEMERQPARIPAAYRLRNKPGDEDAAAAAGYIDIHRAKRIIEKSVTKGVCQSTLATMFDLHPAEVLKDQEMLKGLAAEIGE